jgi:hypothetical protein
MRERAKRIGGRLDVRTCNWSRDGDRVEHSSSKGELPSRSTRRRALPAAAKFNG